VTFTVFVVVFVNLWLSLTTHTRGS